MREIKFRAYWKDYNEMHYLKHLNLECCYKDEDVVLMQYTGLKDKNGMGLTEVYEGDIISEDGILKGNIYEIDKKGTDIIVPQLGTKDWEATYKEIVVRGYDYSE